MSTEETQDAKMDALRLRRSVESQAATIAQQVEDINAFRVEIHGWSVAHERQVAREYLHADQMDDAHAIADALRAAIADNEQSIKALLSALALSQDNVETQRAETDQVRRALVAARATVTAMTAACRDCGVNGDD